MVPPEIVAKHLGFASLSGPARSRLGTLKQYGLIEGRGKVAVSSLAKQIIAPRDPDERKAGLREAALTPGLFQSTYSTHPHASDEALTSYLVRELSFSHSGAKSFIVAYRDTLAYAGVGNAEDNSGGGDEEDGERRLSPVQMASRSGASGGGDKGGSPAVRVFSWPLSAKVTAELRLIGAQTLSRSLFDSLREYLAVAAKMVPEHSEDENGES
jgi:hypothetical protein